MSTFDGRIREYPAITADHYVCTRKETRVALLSHCHTDHLGGFENKSFCIPLYCSEETALILPFISKGKFAHLKRYLRPIQYREPTQIDLLNGQIITLTLLEANHCPGSTMFLIEGAAHTVLYTGDLRAEDGFLAKVKECQGMGIIPKVHVMYLDTTFSGWKGEDQFPTKEESLYCITNIIEQYPKTTTFKISFNILGGEPIWETLYNVYGEPTCLSEKRYALYKKLPNYLKYLTSDPSRTRFHACDWWCDCRYRKDFVYIQASAMGWKGGRRGALTHKAEGTWAIRHNERFWQVCYAAHSSPQELRDFHALFEPCYIFPCVLDSEHCHDREVVRKMFPTATMAIGEEVGSSFENDDQKDAPETESKWSRLLPRVGVGDSTTANQPTTETGALTSSSQGTELVTESSQEHSRSSLDASAGGDMGANSLPTSTSQISATPLHADDTSNTQNIPDAEDTPLIEIPNIDANRSHEKASSPFDDLASSQLLDLALGVSDTATPQKASQIPSDPTSPQPGELYSRKSASFDATTDTVKKCSLGEHSKKDCAHTLEEVSTPTRPLQTQDSNLSTFLENSSFSRLMDDILSIPTPTLPHTIDHIQPASSTLGDVSRCDQSHSSPSSANLDCATTPKPRPGAQSKLTSRETATKENAPPTEIQYDLDAKADSQTSNASTTISIDQFLPTPSALRRTNSLGSPLPLQTHILQNQSSPPSLANLSSILRSSSNLSNKGLGESSIIPLDYSREKTPDCASKPQPIVISLLESPEQPSAVQTPNKTSSYPTSSAKQTSTASGRPAWIPKRHLKRKAPSPTLHRMANPATILGRSKTTINYLEIDDDGIIDLDSDSTASADRCPKRAKSWVSLGETIDLTT